MIIDTAGKSLFAVSISGADTKGTSWKQLIQPLNRGDFPQTRLLRHLKKVEFKGPVSLQCFGIKGDKKANLETSMKTWNQLLTEINQDE